MGGLTLIKFIGGLTVSGVGEVWLSGVAKMVYCQVCERFTFAQEDRPSSEYRMTEV